MLFEGYLVPGAEWVEIVSVRNKNGSPSDENNWRQNLFGRITLCWVAGGFRRRGLFFKGACEIALEVPCSDSTVYRALRRVQEFLREQDAA